MSARTYRAGSLGAALAAVRRSLGDDAVIVETRETASGVEVVAAGARRRRGMRQLFEASRAAQAAPQPRLAAAAGSVAYARIGGDDDLELPEPIEEGRAPTPAERAGLISRPRLRAVGSDEGPSPIAAALEAIDLPPDLSARIAAAAGRGPLGWERVLSWVERQWPIPEVPVGRPGRPSALAFIGPPGSGRSTLVRGLAARAVIDEPGRVVMVQMGFPGRPLRPRDELDAPVGAEVRVANHPSELGRIVHDHRDVSAVLLDLPSVDLHDAGAVRALQRFVAAATRACPAVAWHAVLPARWSIREACYSLRALDFAPLDGVAWTHLDVVQDPGTVVATSLRMDLPPTFLHGDRDGMGEQSGTASWDTLVDWLSAVSRSAASEV